MSAILPRDAPSTGGYRPINNAPVAEIGQSKQLDAANLVGVDQPGAGERWVTLIRPVACSPQGAHVLTLSLGVSGEQYEPGAAAQQSGVLFWCQWGVGGARYSAIVDGRVGQFVSLLGDSIEVAAGFSVVELPNTPRFATATAGLAHGERPGCCYATRTYRRRSLGGEGGSEAEFEVPPFAFGVQVYASGGDYSVGAFSLQLRGGPVATGGVVLDTVDAPALLAAHQGNGYKLPNQTRTVRLTVATVANYTVQFALGF